MHGKLAGAVRVPRESIGAIKVMLKKTFVGVAENDAETVLEKLHGIRFLADRNAAGGDRWVRFLHPRQWRLLDFDRIYSMDWRDTDRFEYYDKKRKKCAEVLVPHCVEPRYLTGAYVVDRPASARLRDFGFALPISIDPALFFH
ncbi:MAG TPA: DarT ssDNA thymidine ADP-ribosyltransferase family protein [Chthoniobacteraceae bacterium]|nr:DarT ssDNA thymidine ADP-ribosyltransferase family protein [Chthoniobacteraceae bacterium]